MSNNDKANHHYVSQCHLRQFLDENKSIYVYDKERDNFYSKQSTRRLFSEGFSNSKEIDGQIDHNSLEDELNDLIENNFNIRIQLIERLLVGCKADDDVYESLNWLSIIGIIGELRHPRSKRGLDSILNKVDEDVLSKMNGYIKKEQRTKYQNLNTYFEMALGILERMGDLKFQIVQITDDNEFVIPDTACFQIRGQLKEYFNTNLQEITQIGIPLTKKLFINCYSHLIVPEHSHIKILKSPSQKLVDKINSNLVAFAFKGVACSNMEYLRRVIGKQDKTRLIARK